MIDKFLERTGRSKADVLRAVGEDPKSSLLSAYASGRSKPSFEMCQKLLMQGMTVRELFGKEVEDKIKAVYSRELESMTFGSPRDIVIKGLKALVSELEGDGVNKPNP